MDALKVGNRKEAPLHCWSFDMESVRIHCFGNCTPFLGSMFICRAADGSVSACFYSFIHLWRRLYMSVALVRGGERESEGWGTEGANGANWCSGVAQGTMPFNPFQEDMREKMVHPSEKPAWPLCSHDNGQLAGDGIRGRTALRAHACTFCSKT